MAWNLFVHTLVERKHNRETIRKVLSRMRHRQLAQAFDCYAGSVNTLVVQRKKLSKTMVRWRATGVKKAWDRWEAYMEEVWQEVTQQARELAKEQLEETARANMSMAEAEAERRLEYLRHQEHIRRSEEAQRLLGNRTRHQINHPWSLRLHPRVQRIRGSRMHARFSICETAWSRDPSTKVRQQAASQAQ